MFKRARIFGVLFAMLLGTVSFGVASAQAATCDLPPSVNGTATPNSVRTNETTLLVGTGFTPGEAVSFYFTLPDGSTFGTANPVEGGVLPDGRVGLPLTITPEFATLGAGRFAITFVGATSQRTAVIYFCVNATPSQPAPTNTAVAPTAVPATATIQPTSVVTSTVQPTVEATSTSAPVATDTVAAATATSAPVETATSVVMDTPTSAPLATTAPIEASPTAFTPGMPTTGQPVDLLPFVLLGLALALSTMVAGWYMRRRQA
ncbi:MAG: hypothetical protein IVW55_07785 [Chloroflexi bacterium]|nr:hypothetical protein [Chloroflexota bacterium]